MTINNSAYGAVSLANGTILCEMAVPNGGISFSPPSVVGDIVVGLTGYNYGGRGAASFGYGNGSMIHMMKNNGSIIVNYELEANIHGGFALYGEYIMFGTGYLSYDQYKGMASFCVLHIDADWA